MSNDRHHHAVIKWIAATFICLAAILFFVPEDECHAESTLSVDYLDKALSANSHITAKKKNKLLKDFQLDVTDTDQEMTDELEKVTWKDNFKKADLKYLACIIYCEANSMTMEAKIAVGNVILNRMREDGDWSHVTTIKEVIYDRKWGVQFSPISNGSMDKALKIYKTLGTDNNKEWQNECMEQSIEAAKQVLCGIEVIPSSFLYFNANVSKSLQKCRDSGKPFKVIEGHIYF